jgi:sugar lactone lactonase YvrE
MTPPVQIIRVAPSAGIAGGEIALNYIVPAAASRDVCVRFEETPARCVAVGARRAVVSVPETNKDGRLKVTVNAGDQRGEADFIIGRKLAGGLHPVTNPAFDPDDGSLYVTRSGSRGEHVPVSIFRVTGDATVEDFSGDIMNPTAIAFGRSGRMFVTSRFDGTVYRVSTDRQMIAFAGGLGVATGLAFNRAGEMFVGDRSGTIFRVNEIGEAKPWAEHEPSVSAYHLAFGPDEALYATGPTGSSFDCVTRFDETGQATTFYRGLGRPHGLAFDREGNLYVAASLRGHRGIVRISRNGHEAELIVAAVNVVGLAFGPNGQMVVATTEAVYVLPLGIQGTLLGQNSDASG